MAVGFGPVELLEDVVVDLLEDVVVVDLLEDVVAELDLLDVGLVDGVRLKGLASCNCTAKDSNNVGCARQQGLFGGLEYS
jgi:hypothetical protein